MRYKILGEWVLSFAEFSYVLSSDDVLEEALLAELDRLYAEWKNEGDFYVFIEEECNGKLEELTTASDEAEFFLRLLGAPHRSVALLSAREKTRREEHRKTLEAKKREEERRKAEEAKRAEEQERIPPSVQLWKNGPYWADRNVGADDMPAWPQELNVIDSKLSSNEVPVYKPKSAKKNRESKKVTAKKWIKAESINKISSAQKDTKSVKTKTSAKSKRQVVSQNVSTSRYTLFSGKNAYFGESVCELEKLSDGCFISKQEVSNSNEELRTLLRSGEFFVNDWQGGYFKCNNFEKGDDNKVIVRYVKTSDIVSASKADEKCSERKFTNDSFTRQTDIFLLFMVAKDGTEQYVARLEKHGDNFITIEELPFFDGSNNMLFDYHGRPCSNTHTPMIYRCPSKDSSDEWFECSWFKKRGNCLIISCKKQRNKGVTKCKTTQPQKESFLEKLKNVIFDFAEVYNQYNNPGDVYVP